MQYASDVEHSQAILLTICLQYNVARVLLDYLT